MQTQVGVIKQASGLVVAVDQNGVSRVLKVGDALYLGEVVKTSLASSKAVVSMDNGKDVTILGDESLKLDENVAAGQKPNTVADVSDLQKALLNGEDLTKLEETAAGGNAAAAGGGDGVSLGAASFDEGGHYSNINENFRSIGDLNSARGAERIGGVSGAADNAGGGAGFVDTTIPTVTLDPINNTSTVVTGKVPNPDPNTTVIVEIACHTPVTVPVNSDGTFSVPTPNNEPLKPGTEVKVTPKDDAGNGTPVTTPVSDVTIPTVTLDPINNTSTVVTGKVPNPDPNTTVIVEIPGHTPVTVPVNSDGTFSVPTPNNEPLKPGTEVKVTPKDDAGNGTPVTTPVSDVTIPTVTLDPINNTSTVVTGKVPNPDPNTTVIVEIPGHTPVTVPVNSDGTFSVPTPNNEPLKPGTEVKVTPKDDAGNGTPVTTPVSDVTIPTVTLDPINNTSTVVTGKVPNPDPNTTVIVEIPGHTPVTVPVNSDGTFSVPTPNNEPLKPGTEVKVTPKDDAGNGTPVTTPVSDVTIPTVTLDPINNTSTVVTGKVPNPDPNTTVIVEIACHTPVTVPVNSDGTFSVPTPNNEPLKPGTEVKVTPKDDAGNGTPVTTPVSDVTIPTVTLDPINNTSTVVTGKVPNPDPNTTVIVEITCHTPVTVPVNSDGTFSVPTPNNEPLKPGTEVKVTPKDDAGNGTPVTTPVSDVTIPTVTLDPINNTSTVVTGKVPNPDPNTTVIVEIPGHTPVTVPVNSDGTFSVPTPNNEPLKPGTEVKVTPKDDAGNGTPVTTPVSDVTIPTVTLDPINNTSTVVTGKVPNPDPNTTVIVEIPGHTPVTVPVNSDGTFSVPTPNNEPLKPGTEVKVTPKDDAGNGTPVTTPVSDVTIPTVTLDPINNTSTVVTGKVPNPDPNTTVIVEIPGHTPVTVPVNSDGTFSVPTPNNEPLKPGTEVKVTPKDDAGNGTPVTTPVSDVTIPTVTLDPINNTSTVVTGKVPNPDPNTTVIVEIPGHTPVTVPVNSDGTFSVPTPNNEPLKPGTEVKVTPKDDAGNGTPVTTPVSDVVPPQVDLAPKADGTVDVVPHDNDATKVEISYTDNGGNTQTITVVKNPSAGWTIDNTPGKTTAPTGAFKLDPHSGKVTISDDATKDNTPVTAKATDGAGNTATGETTAPDEIYYQI
ncbi:retention module-containing protein [Campylobacter concisus]